MRALLAEDKLDGLLTVGHMEAMTMQEWQHARDAGVAVVQVGFRNPKIAPLCSVQPDYEVIGRTMAELIFSHIPSFGSVVLCAGNPKWEQHARIVQGFEDYMQENGAQNRIYLDNSCCIGSEAQRNILNLLEKPDVAACCSVLSQGSVMLVQGLQQCGKAGKVFAVGSDVFEENLDALRSRILDNIVQKNPYAQGYLGIKALVEYLVQGKAPEQRTIYVGSEVVFRSNAVMYDRDNFRGCCSENKNMKKADWFPISPPFFHVNGEVKRASGKCQKVSGISPCTRACGSCGSSSRSDPNPVRHPRPTLRHMDDAMFVNGQFALHGQGVVFFQVRSTRNTHSS